MKFKTTRKAPKMAELTAGESQPPPVTLLEFALKKILVPVDFSESSRKALQYALNFGRQFDAELLLLHVVEPVPLVITDPMGGIPSFNTVAGGEMAVKRLAGWRREVAPLARVRTAVRTGSPQEEIIRAVDEDNIDLIIIGRYGHTGLARLFLGGTAEHVLRHAPCPALVVRTREHDFIVKSEEVSGSKLNRKSRRGNRRPRPV